MRFKMDDSYSDGMCGWVELVDMDTGVRVRQHWSISHPLCQTQEEAREEAEVLLQERIEFLNLNPNE